MIITGIQGSGKTTAADYLSKKYNAEVIESCHIVSGLGTGDYLAGHAVRYGALHDYREFLVECANNDHIIYHMGVIESAVFKLLDLDCTIIVINTDTSNRYDRISKRNVWTIEETKHYYSTVFPGYERALNAVIPLADHIISNNADIETFYSELDNLELSNWEQK